MYIKYNSLKKELKKLVQFYFLFRQKVKWVKKFLKAVMALRKTALLLFFLLNTEAYAGIFSFTNSQYWLKRRITIAERRYHIPKGLLNAIIKVESSFNPYAVNIAGQTSSAKNKLEAVKIIKNALKNGKTNIDIGLAQINYRWHSDKFKNIEAMINPSVNVEYAARFLATLFKQHGTWKSAIRKYHSSNGRYHKPYLSKVISNWLK